MRSNVFLNESLCSLVDGLLDHLKQQGFSETSLSNYKRRLRPIQTYMLENNISIYSPVVGTDYFEYYLSVHNPGEGCSRGIIAAIRRLNDYHDGIHFQVQHVKPGNDQVPGCFSKVCEDYLRSCIRNGNSIKTIERKRRGLARFLSKCCNCGIFTMAALTPQSIIIATADVSNIGEWSDIRLFLRFCFKQGFIDVDLSTFVPNSRRIEKVPDTYTISELNALEGIIDRTTTLGKRDYAIILLADRLGIRAGDIVSLKYDNFDFYNKKIRFVQQKTGEEIALPIPDDVKKALEDYISAQEAVAHSGHVFRKTHAPYDALTSTAVYNQVSKNLKAAGVDTFGKRTGPHTLRASLSTSMVNDDVPYSAVQSVLGHTSRNAIKHYAKTDINKLRRCAISVPDSSGNFDLFLEGGVS